MEPQKRSFLFSVTLLHGPDIVRQKDAALPLPAPVLLPQQGI